MTELEQVFYHDKASNHRDEILASELCGCFSCLRTYPPSEIKEWVRSAADDKQKTCAVCPHCSVDAVLPGSEVNVKDEGVLRAMRDHWFSAHCG